MMRALRQHHISFKNAFAGLGWAIRTQPNFRVHVVLSLLALALGMYLGISSVEMAIILFTIMLGLAAEMINTALESITDLITKEWKEEAKIAKDVSAGMMLTVAIGAVCVAGYIFIPYLLPRLGLY
jgi:diacylglycerol kinase (ATP)